MKLGLTVAAWLLTSMACLGAARAEPPTDPLAVVRPSSPLRPSRPQIELQLSLGGTYRTFKQLTSTGLYVSPSVGVVVPSSRIGLHLYGYASYERGSTPFGLSTQALAFGMGLSAVMFETLRVGPHLALALLQVGRATREENISKLHVQPGLHAEVDIIRSSHATLFAGGAFNLPWDLEDDLPGSSVTLTVGGRFR